MSTDLPEIKTVEENRLPTPRTPRYIYQLHGVSL